MAHATLVYINYRLERPYFLPCVALFEIFVAFLSFSSSFFAFCFVSLFEVFVTFLFLYLCFFFLSFVFLCVSLVLCVWSRGRGGQEQQKGEDQHEEQHKEQLEEISIL